MTATQDFIDSRTLAHEPVRMLDGTRMLVRGAQRLIGVAFALAAIGLWLAPGAAWESDLMLFKLVLSVTAGLAAFGLILAGATPSIPVAQIDTIRREVRLVRPGGEVVQRCAFEDLTRAECEGSHVRLWDADDMLLAEITLANREILKSLVAGLRDAGKLT